MNRRLVLILPLLLGSIVLLTDHQAAHASSIFSPCDSYAWSLNTQCLISVESGTAAGGIPETTYTILNPAVELPDWQYPQVNLAPGDRLQFGAGGCVETTTGGWKDYVAPLGFGSGPNDPLKYHGTVSIAGGYAETTSGGVTQADLTRPVNNWSIQQAINTPVVIAGSSVPNTNDLILRLGYENGDVVFWDAGYPFRSPRDNGYANQCSGKGNAFVTVTIIHGAPVTLINPTTPANTKPFDLVADGVDPNGFPQDPFWGWEWPGVFSKGSDVTQSTAGQLENECGYFFNHTFDVNSCSHDITSMNSGSGNAWVSLGETFFGVCGAALGAGVVGHVNWSPATYTGNLDWESWSGNGTDAQLPGGSDNDFSFFLHPQQKIGNFYPNGLAPAFQSQQGTTAEFDVGETPLDSLPRTGIPFPRPGQWSPAVFEAIAAKYGWWQVFNLLAKYPNPQPMKMLIGGHDVVMIGLVGIDTTHNDQAEVHPIYVMAVRMYEPGDPDYNVHNDLWAIFARNYGDEGECGNDEEYLNAENLSVVLPPPGGAYASLGVTNKYAPIFVGNQTAAVDFYDGAKDFGGAVVTFHLPPPTDQPFVYGYVGLNWSLGQPIPTPTAVPNGTSANPPDSSQSNQVEPEHLLSQWYKSLSPTEQRTYQSMVPRWDPQGTKMAVHRETVRVTSIPPTRPDKIPSVTPRYNALHVKNVMARVLALCYAAAPGRHAWAATCPAMPKSAPGIPTYPEAPVGSANPIVPIFDHWPLVGGGPPWLWISLGLLALALAISLIAHLVRD